MIDRIQIKSSVSALAIALCCLFAASLVAQEANNQLPVTTRSPEALKLYRDGQRELRSYNFPAAQEDWRKALELDPDFAMAHLYLAFVPVNPMDQAVHAQKAIAGRGSVNPGEQKLLDWLLGAMQGKMIPALQAMNDLLAMYPDDSTLNWGAALWLQSRGACDRAVPIYERVLNGDKDFIPAWRGLGECYIRKQDFDKGFAAMKKYVALLPQQAVPEIYYGLALVRAGHYEDGIAQCQAALALDADSTEAWRCVAMGHALKGDGKRARTEYARIVTSPRVSFALTAGLESAATYVQEKDYKQADKAFTEVAEKAHAAGFGITEAEAYRAMAIYQSDPAAAMELLKKAETALEEHQVSRLDRYSKQAAILETRVVLALGAQDFDTADQAAKQLQELVETSHSPVVEHASAGATGAILVGRKQYGEAVTYLAEDSDNPFSLKYLITACEKLRREAAAKEAVKRLVRNNSLAVEQVMILAEFHKQKFQVASK